MKQTLLQPSSRAAGLEESKAACPTTDSAADFLQPGGHCRY